ncbi:MAG TPA: Zn-ribbon domain-containing OB-fold protein [Dehalococcoidia bacterium]|nr:Zn-ribbon domain-containing OB-fold protein [Dehalococcoidia bacterium]
MTKPSNSDPAPDKLQILVQEGLFYQPQSPKEKPYLIGSRCSLCGYVSFPKLMVCPCCVQINTMEEMHITGKGKIDTFSVCYAALPGFQAPSIQGYINLEEGARIWSLITGVEPSDESLKIGMDVELVIGKLREDAEGNEIISYQFKPVKTDRKG